MTVLPSTLLSTLSEVSQPGNCVALQLSISILQKLPRWLLRSCRKLPVSPLPSTPEDTLLQVNCAEAHAKERHPCLITVSFLRKSWDQIPPLLSLVIMAAAHPTFTFISESMDWKLPQQINTGASKILKTKLASTKGTRIMPLLCRFGVFCGVFCFFL